MIIAELDKNMKPQPISVNIENLVLSVPK